MEKDTIQTAAFGTATDQRRLVPGFTQNDSSSILSKMIQNHWTTLFSMGAASFADSVVFYDPGSPGKKTGDEPDLKYQRARFSIGIPDYDATEDTGFVSLGTGGCIILKFSDNILIDGYGPDLYIFLCGSNSEEVNILISQDGKVYRSVGNVTKQHPVVDISPYGETGARYSYVKLRDESEQEEKNTPKLGADIDAVGAINTALIFTIPADNLVLGGSNRLLSSAKKYLSPIASKIRELPGSTILIEAHTDDRGSEEYNAIESQQWTGLIRDYFLDQEKLSTVRYLPIGFGESRPLFSNESADGRRKNRRVEILIFR